MEQDSSDTSKIFFLYFSSPYVILNVLTRREGKLTNFTVFSNNGIEVQRRASLVCV